MAGTRKSSRASRAFTLTELMIAVAVLVGVLLATGKIFSTTSKVTSTGRAAADVLLEASTIERQLRADISRLSTEGFFAIRNVAVPNDLRGTSLLNPSAAPDAILRADQLVFIANGSESPTTFIVGGGQDRKAQGQMTRLYYGHAYQLGSAGLRVEDVNGLVKTHDPFERVFPWTTGTIDMGRIQFAPADPTSIFDDTYTPENTPEDADIAPVDARKWLMVRQPVVLVDDDHEDLDDNAKTRYLFNPFRTGGIATARSIFYIDPRAELGWTPQVFHGRVDAAATELSELRQVIRYNSGSGLLRFWWNGTIDHMRKLISEQLVYYPRAERVAPSMHRVDQALTSSVIGTACSSIRIEWTYADGTGELRDRFGNVSWLGFDIDADPLLPRGTEQPWFGLRDDNIGVAPYAEMDHRDDAGYEFAQTIMPVAEIPNTIESVSTFPGASAIQVYEAIFGFNQETALQVDPVTGVLEPHEDMGFTPWPSAIRVTLTLHDTATTLETGREVQFIIDLPKRFARVRQ